MVYHNKCSVPECKSESKMRHRFPNPMKDKDRFKKWIHAINNMKLNEMDPMKVYTSKRLCQAHFEDKYISSSSHNLLCHAIPTLHLSCTTQRCSDDASTSTKSMAQISGTSTRPVKAVIEFDHCIPSLEQAQPSSTSTFNIIEDSLMDSENEAMPYLKLLCENAENDLIQNNYELQDCLSVEPVFTELETGTCSSESFSVLSNGVLVNDSMTSIKGVTQKMTKKVQIINPSNNRNPIDHSSVSNSSNSKGIVDMICREEDIQGSSNKTQSFIILRDSIFEDDTKALNSINEDQFGKHRRALLCIANENMLECEDSSTSDDLDTDDISDWNEVYVVVSAFKCKVCSFLCESTFEMTDHLKRLHGDLIKLKAAAKKENNGRQKWTMRSLLDTKTSTEEQVTIYLCSTCNNIFSTEELLMEHVEVHKEKPNVSANSGKDELSNIQNEKSSQSMRNLAESLLKKQKKSMKKLKCSVKGCTLKFAKDVQKLRHEECHIPNKKHFRCPECKKEFSVWRICNRHLWTRHEIDAGLYTCPICNKYKSNSPVLVMNHLDIHGSEKPFICPDCKKGFKQLTQLKNHMLVHKKGDDLPPWLKSKNCTICDRIFANSKSLKKHIESVHEKLKPYTCNVCGYKTARKAVLEMHIRQHTGDKPHHCPLCTYKTGDNNCLRKHLRKHYGLMKYSCPHCEYQAIQSTAYKHHIKTKHPESEVIFKCGYCTFTSLKYVLYLTHVKCHEYDEGRRKMETPAVNVTGSNVETDNYEDTEVITIPDESEMQHGK